MCAGGQRVGEKEVRKGRRGWHSTSPGPGVYAWLPGVQAARSWLVLNARKGLPRSSWEPWAVFNGVRGIPPSGKPCSSKACLQMIEPRWPGASTRNTSTLQAMSLRDLGPQGVCAHPRAWSAKSRQRPTLIQQGHFGSNSQMATKPKQPRIGPLG